MDSSDLEDSNVSAYLRSHPKFLQEWLERNAEPELLEKVRKKWTEKQSENGKSQVLEVPNLG